MATSDDTGSSEVELKEVDLGSAKDCDKVDETLMYRLKIFNAKLDKHHFYLVLNSCYRSPHRQKELHYARMFTWTESEISTYLNKTEEEARKIKYKALYAFRALKGLDSINEAQRKIQELASEFGTKPVLPGEEPCPCGCGWPRSKHTYEPSKAIDANIYKTSWWSDTKIVHGEMTQSDQNYGLINRLTRESELVWGINFTEIPIDPIHWELP